MNRFALSLILALAPSVFAGTVNVAFDKPVSGTGALSGEALSTLVDGKFLPDQTPYTSGTVYWGGTGPSILIDLQGTFVIDGAILQGDNNDIYLVESALTSGGPFTAQWYAPASCCFGMATRPSRSDNTLQQSLTPFSAAFIRVSAYSGDGAYSLSEVQVFSNAPEPVTSSMVLLALAALPLCRSKRAQ